MNTHSSLSLLRSSPRLPSNSSIPATEADYDKHSSLVVDCIPAYRMQSFRPSRIHIANQANKHDTDDYQQNNRFDTTSRSKENISLQVFDHEKWAQKVAEIEANGELVKKKNNGNSRRKNFAAKKQYSSPMKSSVSSSVLQNTLAEATENIDENDFLQVAAKASSYYRKHEKRLARVEREYYKHSVAHESLDSSQSSTCDNEDECEDLSARSCGEAWTPEPTVPKPFAFVERNAKVTQKQHY